jgi:hypothetical protein
MVEEDPKEPQFLLPSAGWRAQVCHPAFLGGTAGSFRLTLRRRWSRLVAQIVMVGGKALGGHAWGVHGGPG